MLFIYKLRLFLGEGGQVLFFQSVRRLISDRACLGGSLCVSLILSRPEFRVQWLQPAVSFLAITFRVSISVPGNLLYGLACSTQFTSVSLTEYPDEATCFWDVVPQRSFHLDFNSQLFLLDFIYNIHDRTVRLGLNYIYNNCYSLSPYGLVYSFSNKVVIQHHRDIQITWI